MSPSRPSYASVLQQGLTAANAKQVLEKAPPLPPPPKTIAVVGPCSGPADLVGRPYKELTKAELFAIKKYRCGHCLCEICGFNKHSTLNCPRFARTKQLRQNAHRCLECESKEHTYDQCPQRAALEKSLGRRARRDEVRDGMIGIAYSNMDKSEMREVYSYRRRHNRCIVCGGSHRHIFDCELRKEHFNKRIARKKRDIASGKLKIITKFTGTLTKLPPEVRSLIWTELTREDGVITIHRGMLNQYLYRFGFPFAEVLYAWLRGNVFQIKNSSDLNHFNRILTAFNGLGSVHAIRLPFACMRWCESDNRIDVEDVCNFINKCQSLNKVEFIVDPSSILSDLQERGFYLAGGNLTAALNSIKDEDVLKDSVEAAIITLSKIKHFKGMALIEQTVHPYVVAKVARRVKQILNDQKRADIYVHGGDLGELKVRQDM